MDHMMKFHFNNHQNHYIFTISKFISLGLDCVEYNDYDFSFQWKVWITLTLFPNLVLAKWMPINVFDSTPGKLANNFDMSSFDQKPYLGTN